MNELQIVMIIVGALVIASIFWLHQRRQHRRALLDERPAHFGASTPRQRHNQAALLDEEESVSVIEENGRKVIIDETLEPVAAAQARTARLAGAGDPLDEAAVQANVEARMAQARQQAEADRAQWARQQARPEPAGEAEAAAEVEDAATAADTTQERAQPQVFAIMVLGMHYYPFETLHEALIGCQLEYDQKSRIYVRRNAYGQIYLRVANALNPGTFPAETDTAAVEAFKTPGVALILTLPTVIPAPRAMDEMIRIARRLSQRLDARLYDEKRKRLSESDLRDMRTAALDFVSQPVSNRPA